ncbi:MAG TPA: hypothetical protein VK177_10820 [Flavobacteriales bacterium]|nr:hypothetical protein [Flavobacteriales bacterium]
MQKIVHGLLLAGLLSPVCVNSQNFTYSNVDLVSVTFSGGNLTIKKDNGSGPYSTPQFTAAGNQFPVAYVSNNAPTVAASFTIDCANVPASIWVRGSGSDAMDFPATSVTLGSPSGTVYPFNYPATVGSHVFTDNIVRFFKPFTIEWEFSFDGTTWYPAGTSTNTLYVVRDTPQSETSQFKWFHTVYDLSCRNAQYESTDTGIISHIWTEFLDHVVLNCDDDSLFYYKIMNSPNVTLASLLANKDAECYTFAQLFLAAIKIQGVVRTNNYVYVTPINNTVCSHTVNRFIVKNWTFGTPSAAAECPEFPYKNTYTITTLPPPYTAYVWDTYDISDAVGIYGSCTKNPSSYFNNHQIVKLDGVYYDACYGVTFPNLAAIEGTAFDGYSYRYNVGITYHALFTTDLTQSDLSETITTW